MAELPLWQIDICNLKEAVTQRPPDGERGGGTQSIQHGLFRNNHSDVGAEDSFQACWLKGSKCSIMHGRAQTIAHDTHSPAAGTAQVVVFFSALVSPDEAQQSSVICLPVPQKE